MRELLLGLPSSPAAHALGVRRCHPSPIRFRCCPMCVMSVALWRVVIGSCPRRLGGVAR